MNKLHTPHIMDLQGRTPAYAVAASPQARLAAAIDEYYAGVDAGALLDRRHLLEKYSDVADELEECLTSFEFIRCVAPQLAAAQGDWHAPRASTGDAPASLGDFRLIREIGRGGMGVVYEAEQLSLGRRVAVKVLPFAAMLDERQLARFKNEARAAASLQHPYIVPVFSVGFDRGVHYYAMQYIEGESLAKILSPETADAGTGTWRGMRSDDRTDAIAPADAALPPPPDAPTRKADTLRDEPTALTRGDLSRTHIRRIAQWGVDAAGALHHAHESGVIHRDIKPSNL